MKYSIIIIFVLLLILPLSCEEKSYNLCDDKSRFPNSKIELSSSLSEDDFKQAILGHWESVYEHPTLENVITLKLNVQGEVCLTLKDDNIVEEHQGNYTVGFLRPPTPDFVTLGDITITTSKDTIILSWVMFDYHNAFPISAGLFLRIEKPPLGTLQRI